MQDEQLRELAEKFYPGDTVVSITTITMRNLLVEFARTVRAQVLRDAADKMCKWCAADKKLIEREKCYISNYGPFDGGLIHYVGLDSDSGYAECEAAALRAQAEKEKA